MSTTSRTCTVCHQSLPLDGYYRTGSKVMARCKTCFNRTCVERWRRLKQEEVGRMGGRCADCGGEFHPDVFDFHHLDPTTKELAWVQLRLVSKLRRRAELAKCVLLCANCHRLRHVGVSA